MKRTLSLVVTTLSLVGLVAWSGTGPAPAGAQPT